mgnify:CR=1 FL=1
MQLNLIIKVFLLILIFIFGLFLGNSYSKIPYLQFDPKVDIISILNLIVALSLALIIPYAVTTRLENKRCHKDMLISDLRVLSQSVTEIEEFIDSLRGKIISSSDHKTVLSLFKKSRQHIVPVQTGIEDINHHKLKSTFNEVETVNQKFLWLQWSSHNVGLNKIKQLSYEINRY